jgi:hypothetical protein
MQKDVYRIALVIEAKEEPPIDSGPEGLPTTREVIEALSSHLADYTKHSEQLGWRVTSILNPGGKP